MGGEMSGFFNTPEFAQLIAYMRRVPMLRRELTCNDEAVRSFVPVGCDPDDVWDAAMAIRRAEAYFSPNVTYVDGSVLPSWHTVPESLALSLRLVSDRTRCGSALDSIVSEREGARFITQQYVQEMVANLRLDGRPSEYEDVRAVLLGDRPPADDAERLAGNFHAVMVDLGRYASGPVDRNTLAALYERLTDGVSDAPLDMPPRSPLEPVYMPSHLHADLPQGYAEDIVEAVANDRATESTQHPVMVSFLVNCQFWRFPVFERYNNLMGCVVSRLYLYRRGYPVFRYVPKIWILEEWKAGLMRNVVAYDFAETLVRYRGSLDWTVYYDTVMRLLLRHIDAMEASLVKRKSVDDRALAGVERVPYLSYRQRAVLRRAVLVSDTVFHILEHQREFGCAYSTARADLEKLVELGYLTRTSQGTRHDYRAVPQLKQMLAGL